MADDMTKEQLRARGDRARVVLEDAVMNDALRAVEGELTGRLLRTDLKDTEQREALFAEYHGVKRIVAKLRVWAGEAAQIASETE